MEYRIDINKGKWFDASKTKQVFESMQKAAEDYCKKSDATGEAYQDFVRSDGFKGEAADATKNFIGKGMASMNIQVADEHRKCVEDQIAILDGFSMMVDSSPNAYIDYDVLDIINSDFVGYYENFRAIAQTVDIILSALNSEFGKEFGEFPSPDKDGVAKAFADLCSVNGSTGFVKESQAKFVKFDDELNKHVSKNDTEAFAGDIKNKVTKATNAFNSAEAPQINTNPNVKALWGIDIPLVDDFLYVSRDFFTDLFTDPEPKHPFDGEGTFGGDAHRLNIEFGNSLESSLDATQIALANAVFYITRDLSDEDFEKAFGIKKHGFMGDLNYWELAHIIKRETLELDELGVHSNPNKLIYFLKEKHGLDVEVEYIDYSDDSDLIRKLQDALKDGYAVNCGIISGYVDHFLKDEQILGEDVSITSVDDNRQIFYSYNGKQEVMNEEHPCLISGFYKARLKPAEVDQDAVNALLQGDISASPWVKAKEKYDKEWEQMMGGLDNNTTNSK